MLPDTFPSLDEASFAPIDRDRLLAPQLSNHPPRILILYGSLRTRTEMAAFWCIDYGNGTLQNQYITASDFGQKLHASAFGLGVLAEGAAAEGFRQFSFGRSTKQDGWQVNATLQKFKANFAAGLAAQFNIEIELDQLLSGAMEQASIL